MAGTFEGSIVMRDACYGVVCALSRSAQCETFIFSGSSSTTAAVSIDTATLLFACAANEEETPRPRAVAALDALLGAYCHVHVVCITNRVNSNGGGYESVESGSDNSQTANC